VTGHISLLLCPGSIAAFRSPLPPSSWITVISTHVALGTGMYLTHHVCPKKVDQRISASLQVLVVIREGLLEVTEARRLAGYTRLQARGFLLDT
jgi:hypothetical protein